MKMNRVKGIIKILVFSALAVFLLARCYSVLAYKHVGNGGGIENYYRAQVPVDVVAYGSSHAHCTINNGLLWDTYGMSCFTLSGADLKIDGIYYLMAESFRENPPTVAWVETYTFPEELAGESTVRQVGMNTHWSTAYASYVQDIAARFGWDRAKTTDYLLRLPVIHSRYQELEESDFRNMEPYMRGYRGSNECTAVDPPALTEERAELPENTLAYMDKIVQLCAENGVPLYFFNAPYTATEAEMAAQNAIRDYAALHGIPYLGFNHEAESYDIDFSEDMREEGHVNDDGAAKVTLALAEATRAQQSFPDHRGEGGYEDWEKHSRYLSDRSLTFSLEEQEELPAYLQAAGEGMNQCIAVISLQGNYRALGDEAYAPYLVDLGIDPAFYETGGILVLRDGEPVFTSAEASYQFFMSMGNRNDLALTRGADEAWGHIFLNGRDYAGEQNGLTILFYDPEVSYLIDCVHVDIYQGLGVLRTENDE